jgi:hypothetical protein
MLNRTISIVASAASGNFILKPNFTGRLQPQMKKRARI